MVAASKLLSKLFQISLVFLQGFPVLCSIGPMLHNTEDFQRKLWRFCGISRGYKGQKPKVSIPKFFRGASLFLVTLPAPSGHVPLTRVAGRARSADSREGLRHTLAEGGFMAEHRYGSREIST